MTPAPATVYTPDNRAACGCSAHRLHVFHPDGQPFKPDVVRACPSGRWLVVHLRDPLTGKLCVTTTGEVIEATITGIGFFLRCPIHPDAVQP